MLQENELEDLFDLHNITPEARARLRWIRENAPIRSVNTGIKNTPCRFCSRKMDFVLEAEAFNTEYAAFEEYDNSDHVLEFYPQPCKLRISYINANGRLVHPDITPDIFQVCRDYFAFVECKTEEELLKLAEAQPNRYQLDGQGKWRSPPGEAAAEKLGCRFILRSSSENNWIEVPPVISATGNLVKSVFEKENGLEEAVFRRADHRFFAAGGSRRGDQGTVPATRLQ